MSVGNSNLTGIPARIAPPPRTPIQATQNNQTNNSPRAAALANANAPTNAPPALAAATSAVGVTAAPAGPGGTTTPTTGKGVQAAPAVPQALTPGTVANATAMSAFAPFLAAAGAAGISNRSRVTQVSGDAKEQSGDVAVETKAEAEGHLATKDTNSETGREATDISGANSTSGPST